MPPLGANPYGFDHNRPERACEQLRTLLGMESQPHRYDSIKDRLRELTHQRLDPSQKGCAQTGILKEIEDELEKTDSRIFGPLAPDSERRRYFAIRVVLLFHRARRTSRQTRHQASRSSKENRLVISGDVIDLTAEDGSTTKRLRRAIPLRRCRTNTGSGSRTSPDVMIIENPSKKSTATSKLSARSVRKPTYKRRKGARRRSEVIVIDESDKEVDAMPSISPVSSLPSRRVAVSSCSSSNVQASEPILNPLPPSNKDTSRAYAEYGAIRTFLATYPSPPMTEYLSRIVDMGIRTMVHVAGVSRWSPEDRLKLLQTLKPSPAGFPVTDVDLIAFERAFVRYYKENVENA